MELLSIYLELRFFNIISINGELVRILFTYLKLLKANFLIILVISLESFDVELDQFQPYNLLA
jgi:hypothetical protein